MKVREARPADLEAVARVQARAMVASDFYEHAVELEPTFRRQLERVTGYFYRTYHPSYALPARALLVAEARGRVVGFVAGHRSTRMGCQGELQWMFALPEWQRRGVGGELLGPMARWFAERGCSRVILDAPPENPSRAFYLEYGAIPLDDYWLYWRRIGRDVEAARRRRSRTGPAPGRSTHRPPSGQDRRRRSPTIRRRIDMSDHRVVTRDEWLAARRAHLAKEKELTRLRDRLSRERRELPWVRVDKEYEFEGAGGKETLADLFAGRSQLVIYHFMYGPDWPEGCPSCSFWADNFNGIDVHLAHRDITLIAVSRAPWKTLEAYRRRMGWSFKLVSSYGSDFNHDYRVSFTPEEMERGEVDYNFGMNRFPAEEAPGISVFYRNERGEVFHTYSCYARGLDMLNGAYHYMDLTPKGRDEDDLPHTMAWLRRRDQYED